MRKKSKGEKGRVAASVIFRVKNERDEENVVSQMPTDARFQRQRAKNKSQSPKKPSGKGASKAGSSMLQQQACCGIQMNELITLAIILALNGLLAQIERLIDKFEDLF